MSAGGKAVELFGKMFPDSIIANKMELRRLKIAYILVYGLAKYYQEELITDMKDCGDVVILFDESMNRCAQRQQMGFAGRYWSSELDEVSTRYLKSAFLGRATATDLLKAFKTNVPVDLLKRLEMVSMDGPNVHFKFLREFKIDLKKNPDDPVLLIMGSCGLHVASNAFKAGSTESGWDLPLFLRSANNIFEDNPSRKSIYSNACAEKNENMSGDEGLNVGKYSGTKVGECTICVKFPMPFSTLRWLCNSPVAVNAVECMPNLKKFVEYVESGNAGISIDSQRYRNVVKSLKDVLFMCKLAFFTYVAGKLEPFMREFQTNDPLAPFLFTELNDLLADVMKDFVKANVIAEASNMCSIDVKDKRNLIAVKDLKLSHSVRAELRKVKVKDADMLIFKQQCMEFLKAVCLKIIDKSPLKYSLCKAITFCDPAVISKNSQTCLNRLSNCLTVYRDNNRLSAADCDLIESEFTRLILKDSVIRAMADFSRKTQRLDHFSRGIFRSHGCTDVLVKFIRSILILSHGNAYVERGFCTNKEMIIENQRECSLVGLRQVYDGVQSKGGLKNVVVDKNMISKVRSARSAYEDARRERAARDKVKETEVKKKRAIVAITVKHVSYAS